MYRENATKLYINPIILTLLYYRQSISARLKHYIIILILQLILIARWHIYPYHFD